MLATVPGWGSEDNGLLHVRGVDEGVLYVVDGVPSYERFDSLFGVAPDPMTLESITVSTGYIPPEFGFKSGAVVEVRSVSSVADRWAGSGEGLLASDDAVDGAVVVGGPLSDSSSLALNLGSFRSSRFLDPTHPDNFHNSGSAMTGGGRVRMAASPSSSVLQAVAGVSGSRFEVPHDELQEAAGQDQRQRVGGSWQTVSWQRAWSPATITHRRRLPPVNRRDPRREARRHALGRAGRSRDPAGRDSGQRESQPSAAMCSRSAPRLRV